MPQPSLEYYDNLDRVTFIYPHYESPFVVSINPNHSLWMERYCYQWAIDNSGPMKNNPYYVDLIMNSDLALYSACTFISANWHRLEKLEKFCTIFFILDDYHDVVSKSDNNELKCGTNFWNDMNEMLDQLKQKKIDIKQHWPDFIKAIQVVLKEIYFDFTDQQINRSVNMIKDYVQGNTLEAEWEKDNNVVKTNSINETQDETGDDIPDWDIYMRARLGSVGGQMTQQLIEYAKNIALTDDEWNHTLMKCLIKAVSEEMILINDHFTFRKEIKENNFTFSKMRHVYTILIKQGYSLQEAVNKTDLLIREKDQLIFNLIEQILKDEQLNSTSEASQRLKIYLDGVKEVVGGYWRFAISANRYHGKYFKGTIPPTGRFTYDPNQTIVKSDKEYRYEWLQPIPNNVQPK